MWQPEPGWHPLPSGAGASTLGVWRTASDGGRPLVVKRLGRPRHDDPGELSEPARVGWWRREADVAETGLVLATPGLCGVRAAVEEDSDGVTITREWVEDASVSGLRRAVSLGRFTGADLPRTRFLARTVLADRLARVERRGGWPTLQRTAAADVADHLWQRRGGFLDRVAALPQVPQHGDPTATNLLGRRPGTDDVVAVDWATLGVGHVGGDLGYLSLSAREGFEPLLEAYLLGRGDHPADGAEADDVRLGAQVTAVYTALSRAEWALARVASGEGPLGAKLNHPAVAPHLRALQRHHEQVEALLEG